MKIRLLFICSYWVLLSGLFVACAEEADTSASEWEKKRIEAYLSLKGQNMHQTASGTYYTVLKQGTGRSMPDTATVFYHENKYDFNENILGTSYEEVARQLGLYSRKYYYGPIRGHVGVGTNLYGLEENMKEMRQGEKRRILLPSYLSGYVLDNNFQNAAPLFYDIEITDIIDNIDKWEIDTLEAYKSIHYPGLDSLKRGFYRKVITPGTGDTIKANTTVKVWYVGKFLNGHVFDTNIADTAAKYFISPSSTSEYSIAIPEYNKETDTFFDKASSGNETSSIMGFYRALMGAQKGSTIAVFFHSQYGYGAEGKNSATNASHYLGSTMPAYMPLFFWIRIPDKTDND